MTRTVPRHVLEQQMRRPVAANWVQQMSSGMLPKLRKIPAVMEMIENARANMEKNPSVLRSSGR